MLSRLTSRASVNGKPDITATFADPVRHKTRRSQQEGVKHRRQNAIRHRVTYRTVAKDNQHRQGATVLDAEHAERTLFGHEKLVQ
ncbi:hypothetical protein B0H14DRAFT_3480698 [Mycena olivaceomarginata]|nr:hypothetical protein B0H14DRAFT_3480698 [Mycena olivaceomarginata]